jgi:hypothetical protein
MKINEQLWKLMKTHEHLMRINEKRWKFVHINENQCFGAWAGVRMLAKSSFGGLCGVVRGCARTLLGSTLFTYIIVYIYIYICIYIRMAASSAAGPSRELRSSSWEGLPGLVELDGIGRLAGFVLICICMCICKCLGSGNQCFSRPWNV